MAVHLDKFTIFETAQFLRDLTQDFSGQHERIAQKLQDYAYPQLRQNPYYGKNIKKLKSYTPDTWRYRIGDYRFFYEIDVPQKTVFMLAADKRGDAY